ncbi:MAG: 4,5-DOPA dioxygenase extradiol [Bacteroidia bacterium]|nr:4,5-DOPA dioxygenase extradiol [Bacteroidia bacterium]
MNIREFTQISDEFGATPKMPALFIGHGSPMNALEDNAFTKAMKSTGSKFTGELRPNAILVVSAHWLTKGSFVHVSPNPETIHDFGGFPKELFDMQYPAPGSPEYAGLVSEMAPEIHPTTEWGLDHGTWTILKHLFPDADIPVFQVSIDYYQPMQYHFDLSQKLQKLREKGVLIIGSGNIVHNLGMSMGKLMQNDASPYDWAIEFDDFVKTKTENRDFNALIEYEKAGKSAKLSVPTPDHYIPLLYTLGQTQEKDEIKQIYEEVYYGGLSMRTIQIG